MVSVIPTAREMYPFIFPTGHTFLSLESTISNADYNFIMSTSYMRTQKSVVIICEMELKYRNSNGIHPNVVDQFCMCNSNAVSRYAKITANLHIN